MSTLEQTEAFDNLTEEIQKFAKNMGRPKCSCCGSLADSYIKVYLCKTHINKYGDILNIENGRRNDTDTTNNG